MYNDNEFDSLRKQATLLERNLEGKLSNFLASNTSSVTPVNDLQAMEGGSADSPNTTLTLGNEIQSLLTQFNAINQQLANAATKSSHELVLKRFREVSIASKLRAQRVPLAILLRSSSTN